MSELHLRGCDCESKVCTVCHISKPLTGFHKQARGKFGREARCKSCRQEAYRAYMANESNRRRINAIQSAALRERLAADPERARAARVRQKRRNESPEGRQKHLARRTLIRAVNSGKLTRQPCEKCGAPPPTQGHHHDYSKPLEVRWLCAACHGREHREAC